jgi:hypothetical protein
MKKNRIISLIVIAMMMFVALACEFSVSTANIQSAKLSSDKSGSGLTTVFSQDDVFWCLVQLANAPDDTTLKAVWTGVEVEGEEPNTLIDQSESTVAENSSYMTFSLTNDGLWPTGKYKIDLYLNDKLERTLEFTVQ